MREILFRGKRVDNDKWVYGSLIVRCCGAFIVDKNSKTSLQRVTTYNSEFDWRSIEVKPETVGEFTNLTDKNGNKIFEGDIVKSCFRSDADKEPMTVEFHAERRGWFPFACGDGCGCCEEDTYLPISVEVIGNVYDNKEEEK